MRFTSLQISGELFKCNMDKKEPVKSQEPHFSCFGMLHIKEWVRYLFKMFIHTRSLFLCLMTVQEDGFLI